MANYSEPNLPLPSSAKTLEGGSSANAVKWNFDELEVGQRLLGKYEIVRMLGEGGMGQVYQAYHVDLRTMVAIKILNIAQMQNERAAERFKLEARASAKVVHPNAVRVFDYGVHDGVCFLVMEYLQGESLRRQIAKRKIFPLQEAIKIIEQICCVLEIMHNIGIVHRDLKPENIFLHKEEKGEVVKVFDFGLAKMISKQEVSINTFGEKLTTEGMIIGTPHYMSPEQCLNLELDGRADLYSLGIILYEMLSGRTPFESEQLMMVLSKHVSEPPAPLCEIAKDVPRAVSDVIQRVLSKDPKKRHQSANNFLEDLCAAAQITNSAYLKKIARESSKAFAFKKRLLVYGIAAASLVLTAVAGTGLWKRSENISPKAETRANVSVKKPIRSAVRLNEDFAFIPGGKVVMGRNAIDCPSSIPDCTIARDEIPSHSVELAPYYLSRYEVTNKEYREFVTASGYKPPKGIWNGNVYRLGMDNHPVAYVSWEDAVSYCKWLSKRDGIKYRLPAEAEWEYAARGDDSRFFPWGNNLDASLANFGKPPDVQTPLPIDKPPNNTDDRSPFGIFAMAGNVAEWTASDFEAYPNSEYKPKNQDLKCKVFRGGNFNSLAKGLRTTVRTWMPPSFKAQYLGFRLAATPPENESKK